MAQETRPQMIARLIDENRAKVEAEAERYKDKQMDASKPGLIECKFLIRQVVRLKLDEDGRKGFVIGIDVREQGVTYLVSWPHDGTEYYAGFELELVPDDEAGSPI